MRGLQFQFALTSCNHPTCLFEDNTSTCFFRLEQAFLDSWGAQVSDTFKLISVFLLLSYYVSKRQRNALDFQAVWAFDLQHAVSAWVPEGRNGGILNFYPIRSGFSVWLGTFEKKNNFFGRDLKVLKPNQPWKLSLVRFISEGSRRGLYWQFFYDIQWQLNRIAIESIEKNQHR